MKSKNYKTKYGVGAGDRPAGVSVVWVDGGGDSYCGGRDRIKNILDKLEVRDRLMQIRKVKYFGVEITTAVFQ